MARIEGRQIIVKEAEDRPRVRVDTEVAEIVVRVDTEAAEIVVRVDTEVAEIDRGGWIPRWRRSS